MTPFLHAGFRQPEVLHLALLYQVLHRSGDILDGDVRVNTVLIEQVDRVDLEPLERGVGDLLDMRGPTVQADRLAPFVLEPELGRDHDLIAHRGQRVADELLVGERAVSFRCVEERDATFDGRTDE